MKSFPSRITDHESRITPSALWTVVPVRGIANGKSRLAAVLDPAGRARLNRLLLTRTLEVMHRWRGDLARCVVVSPCQETLATAARLGAAGVCEPPDACDLNAAAALGAARADENGASSVLIIPCDLPFLTPESLAAVTGESETARHLVIAPDRAGTGTNALLMSAQRPFEFRFGEHSFTRHLSLAAERGWTAAICRRPELAFDLDTPEDLAAWTERAEIAGERARPLI